MARNRPAPLCPGASVKTPPTFRPGGHVPSCVDPCSRSGFTSPVHMASAKALAKTSQASPSPTQGLAGCSQGAVAGRGARSKTVRPRPHDPPVPSSFLSPRTYRAAGIYKSPWDSLLVQFHPRPGKIPHTVGRLSLSTAGTEAACASLHSPREAAETKSRRTVNWRVAPTRRD